MNDVHSDTATDSTFAGGDSRLFCPRCSYNLTGLTQPRCPECGSTFDWAAVRQARDHAPIIAFERMHGWRKVGAFFVTWATVLFAPWVFARQVTSAYSLRHALSFGLICFVPVTIRYVIESTDWETYLPWLLTAATYVVLQAALMIVLDPTGWREPRSTFRFWLAVGGYTTAIVATEFWEAAPLLQFSDVVGWLGEIASGNIHWPQLTGWFDPGWIGWSQLVLWLVGLACVYYHRLSLKQVSVVKRLIAIPVVATFLLMLYAFCVEYIGANLLYGTIFDKVF